ncbi:unnamed protein product [Mytilus coruscus]|uniref:Uncharacterized protein n=1 Tax=Mytilus coruscus TaxID=42192 RepID=A0A6J8EVX3_MYTCO|nr:unnamed protein product [Mytilus coruscus]
MRLINAIKDNLSSDTQHTVITSGSFGEGLAMRGSDIDVMFVCKTVPVYNVKPSLHSNITYFLMDTDDVKLGFTRLRFEFERDHFPNFCKQKNGKYYLSNALYKQAILNDILPIIHGPCVSNKEGTVDLAICLHCNTWVSVATQWIIRPSNQWPSYDAYSVL